MNNLFDHIEEAPVDSLELEWNRLAICKELSDVIKKEFKFNKMTPVQAASIPLILENKDVIVEAKTGSGKTLAFLIPIIEVLIRRHKTKAIESHEVLALLLSPTRELATQIHQELRKILRNTSLLGDDKRLGSLLIVGGNSVANDIQKYKKFGANVIVATPGRLSGILEMADNELSSCIRKKLMYLVFDEADQLLSFGFEKNLSSILAYLPKQRRTSLFSATQTNEVEELIKSGLRNPIKVNVNQLDRAQLDKAKRRKIADCDVTKKLEMPNKLENYYIVCDSYAHKLAVLTNLLKSNDYHKILVFLSTCFQVDYFSQCLELELGKTEAVLSTEKKSKKFHPKEPQLKVLKLHRRLKNKRAAIFKKFKSSQRCVLFVTDILSRGIDVPDISCVIHLDLPTSPECYVHRSGRSGHQIEVSGTSILLLEPFEMDYIEMCRRRQIVLEKLESSNCQTEDADSLSLISERLINWLRRRALESDAYQTLGVQAFVSYIRFYSSKLCLRELLFPKLPIAKLASSFGLIRLPKMPELKIRYKAIEAEFEATLMPESNDSLNKG